MKPQRYRLRGFDLLVWAIKEGERRSLNPDGYLARTLSEMEFSHYYEKV